MATYDFSTLNSADLEELVCDLLNANRPSNSEVYYKTYKDGKDSGIDILYSSTQKTYDHVGQVKHFYRTGYKGLFYTLSKEELKKVRVLEPNKYILATSIDLSVKEAEKIKNLFDPYIKNLGDIYGCKDINALLEIHEDLLYRHYKLWFSDTSILSKLLNSGFEFRSSIFIESEFKKRLRLYVKTPLFDKARESLKENKFIIITGEPGVGKTTLAEMLAYEYILNDYKLTYVYDNINDADKALTPTEEKQLIYFDDFLGSNAVEINKAKGSETSLRKILRRVQTQANKLIIFTTRSFLLNTAIEESENLKRFNIKASESILNLSEYTESVKRLILHNHIEDSDLTNDVKDVLRLKDVEDFIVKHNNFTPRSIEYITTSEIARNLTSEQYHEYILASFNSPVDIWAHAYSEQINEDDRILLNTLLSFGESANLTQLDKAFHYRLEYEILNNNRTKTIQTFYKSLRRLDGGFILLKKEEVFFINPSLIDFLLNYLRNDKDEVRRIAENVCFTSQLTKRLFSLSSPESLTIPITLEKRLLEDYYSFLTDENSDLDLIRLALVIHKYIKKTVAEEVVCNILNEIENWDSLYEDYSLNFYFREFMEATETNAKISAVIKGRIVDILTDLVVGEQEINEAIEVLEDIVKKFNVNLSEFEIDDLENHFIELFDNYLDQEIDWLRDNISDSSEAYDKKSDISNLLSRVHKTGININVSLKVFDRISWIDVSLDNEFRRQMAKDD